ncbi:MAG: transglycosylase SLT domain-containing protein [Saprospiraceae bacterium]|nr:transglycosylase SLT domain-containing protein [Saprospiraceae bacterium]
MKSIFSILIVVAYFQHASSNSGVVSLFSIGNLNNNPAVLEDLIITRLETMQCLVDPRTDDDVIDQVKRFVGRNRSRALELLHRTETYFPLIDKILAEYGLPNELKYLTIVESSLVINAKSYAGAAGLWQLMPSTARILNLRVDDKIDQRLDPVLSTHAAAKYFKTLYGMFNDWSLVLAAYNCGEYKVKRLMQNSNKKDFWSLRSSLPRQTQLFIPAFIGATYFIEFSEEHEMIIDEEHVESKRLTFAKIFKEVRLKDLYKKTAITSEVFKLYNPGYKRALIPANVKGYYVSLPDSLMVEFIDFYTYSNHSNKSMSDVQPLLEASSLSDAQIISFCRPQINYPDNIGIVQVNEHSVDYNFELKSIDEIPIPAIEEQPAYVYHIVAARESLYAIAEYHQVDLEDLISWNEIKQPNALLTGTVLKIQVVRQPLIVSNP